MAKNMVAKVLTFTIITNRPFCSHQIYMDWRMLINKELNFSPVDMVGKKKHLAPISITEVDKKDRCLATKTQNLKSYWK